MVLMVELMFIFVDLNELMVKVKIFYDNGIIDNFKSYFSIFFILFSYYKLNVYY